MKVALAADHAGYEDKEKIKKTLDELGVEYTDMGTDSFEPVDYPDYAEAVGSLNDFMRMHPTSKQLDIASYYLAMAHYDQMGRPDQDQTHTQSPIKRGRC